MTPPAPFQRDLSAAVEERRFEVGAPDHGRRLDAFLAERLVWRSRTRIQSAIAAGRVTIERGKDREPPASDRVRAGTRLRAGNELVVRLDSSWVDAAAEGGAPVGSRQAAPLHQTATAGRSGVRAEPASPPRADFSQLDIVYEDDHLLAVSKPPRMSIYPTRGHLGGSLTELLHRRRRALGLGGSPPSPCHRLDRETSGLVLYAKDRATRADVGLQFEARTVEKTYLALVLGSPAEDAGVIDLPLGRDLGSRVEVRQGPRRDGGGLEARTLFKVRARFGVESARPPSPESGAGSHVAGAGDHSALLELHPETGRQHQLRAHLAAIGHPILGDKLYLGGDDLFLASLGRELLPAEIAALGGTDRMALHAWRLTVRHPATGARLALEAPSEEAFFRGSAYLDALLASDRA